MHQQLEVSQDLGDSPPLGTDRKRQGQDRQLPGIVEWSRLSEIPRMPYDGYNRVNFSQPYDLMQLFPNAGRLDHKAAPIIMIMVLIMRVGQL